MKIYIVMEPASDPYAGGDYIIEIFATEENAKKMVEEYNKDKKYEFEKFYIENWEVKP